jgi:threonine aldolase
MKISFKNDYSQGCHPKILEALAKNNFDAQNGYGLDDYSINAGKIIRQKINNDKAKVHFVSGGTQANLIVISAFLKPYESVVSAVTGHILNNESGAIEATGHKINSVETDDGKLNPKDIEKVIDAHQNTPHQVKQKLVYISNSTELGTIYSKDELKNLYRFCKEKNLLLFMDGARLSQALAAETNDLTLKEIAEFTDVFYFGGTKNGALIGEAIVINNENLQDEFGFNLKQKGAMLAKSRLLGIQFQELLRDDLFLNLARHANKQAMKIKIAFLEIGVDFLSETFTNQIFPILANHQIAQLSQNFDFYVWKKIDNDKSAVRIITSWATSDETIEKFIREISDCSNNIKKT